MAPTPWINLVLLTNAIFINSHTLAFSPAGPFIGSVGEPGSVLWAPLSVTTPTGSGETLIPNRPDYYNVTAAGKAYNQVLDFYRYLNSFDWSSEGQGFFTALLFDYVINQHVDSLQRWMAYLDDYTMNAAPDVNNSPIGMRLGAEQNFLSFIMTALRIMLDERPALATDFSPTTLARLVILFNTDFFPYNIRAKRVEMSNWGTFTAGDSYKIARYFNEFYPMRYFASESWRLFRYNWITHRTLDGENFEAWDEAHNIVDIIQARNSMLPSCAASGNSLEMIDLCDNMRLVERSLVRHITPEGNYVEGQFAEKSGSNLHYVWGQHSDRNSTSVLSNLNGRYLTHWQILDPVTFTDTTRTFLDEVNLPAENEAKTRIAAMNGTSVRPSVKSEMAPYGAMYYLRDGWQWGDEFMMIDDFKARSQASNTEKSYSLYKNALALLQGSPIIVDKRQPNIMHGLQPTGGKTMVTGQAGRHVSDGRFFTSSRFDVAETKLNLTYSYNNLPGFVGSFYPFPQGYSNPDIRLDPAPVAGVQTTREVFKLRNEGLYIVYDRIIPPTSSSHEYAQYFAFPWRKAVSPTPTVEQLKQYLDVPNKTFSTQNPDFDNVTVRNFGPTALTLSGYVYDSGRNTPAWRADPTLSENLNAATTGANANNPIYEQYFALRWNASATHASVWAINTRSASNGVDLQNVKALRGAAGEQGFSATTPSGTQVWFMSAANLPGNLSSDLVSSVPVSASGEALLAINKDDEISGIALGTNTINIKGKSYTSSSANFQYVLTKDGEFSSTPIGTPIDTVHISPEQTVFTDTLQVSFDIPTQPDLSGIDLRYTLDGSDPTSSSLLYTAPITISSTTLVKVRPIRQGKTPVWNAPDIDAGRTISAIFTKVAMAPAAVVASDVMRPGLAYHYFEGDWLKLFSLAGVPGALTPLKISTAKLFDPDHLATIRNGTDRSYALRYNGLINIPTSGVYNFYPPTNLYAGTQDAGFDLRVFIDGKEWQPNPMLHAENVASMALAAGSHTFVVSLANYAWKTFRNDYWMGWRASEMASALPVIMVSGPDMNKQLLPDAWLSHQYLAGVDHPTPPVITASPIGPSNGKVTVTIKYSAESVTKEYMLAARGTWTTYSAPLTLTANDTISARGTDSAGSVSPVSKLVLGKKN